MDEIFERSLESGYRRLNFEQFEKACIMVSCLFFPGIHGAEAYVKWIDEVLRRVASIKSPHFMDASVERAALIAEALLEKKYSCAFHPLMERVGDAEKPPVLQRSKSEERFGRESPVETRTGASMDRATFDKLVKDVAKGMRTRLRSETVRLATSPAKPSESVLPDNIDLESLSDAGSTLLPKRLSRIPRSAKLVRKRASEPLGPVPHDETHEHTLKFQEILIHEFGDLDFAFEYLDSVTGARTKQISSTKFRFGWKALSMTRGDMKQVFSHIDFKGDGVITIDELKGWREFRERQLLRAGGKLI